MEGSLPALICTAAGSGVAEEEAAGLQILICVHFSGMRYNEYIKDGSARSHILTQILSESFYMERRNIESKVLISFSVIPPF
jgi:hypothetical protein